MPRDTEKKTITYSEYLSLVGLHTLAQHHERSLTELLKAASFITGQKAETGSKTAELIYCSEDRTVDQVLEHLNIAVEPIGDHLHREEFGAAILERYDAAMSGRSEPKEVDH